MLSNKRQDGKCLKLNSYAKRRFEVPSRHAMYIVTVVESEKIIVTLYFNLCQ